MNRCLWSLVVGLGSLVNTAPADDRPGSVIQPQPRPTVTRRFRFFDRENRRYVTYQFGKRAHVEHITAQLWTSANALCWTAHHNYKGNADWRTAYKEMYRMVTGATHIRKLAKEGYHRQRHDDDHIIRDLMAMDKLIDHVRDDVRYWNRTIPVVPGTAPAPGEDESLLVRLAKLEDTLHHLMRDYGAAPRNGRRTVVRPATRGVEIAPKP